MITDIPGLLQALAHGGVRFVLIGGVAAVAHGSSRVTQDVDIVYARDPGNVQRLAAALAPLRPYPRGVPPGLPFVWDARTISNGLNFTLDTASGSLDLFGEIAGGGTYESLAPQSIEIEVFGVKCLLLGLEGLVAAKRAAGRAKDLDAVAELEAILERTRSGGG